MKRGKGGGGGGVGAPHCKSNVLGENSRVFFLI